MAIGRNKKEIMALIYRREEPYLYGCVQFFEPSNKKQHVGPHRQSAPFVISQSIGDKEEFIYGCVLELICEIRRLMADIKSCQGRMRTTIRSGGIETNETPDISRKVVRVTISKGTTGNKIFFDYTREITNILLLLSYQTRNLFEIVPRLNSETVSLLNYEGQVVGKIRMKELFDYLAHNRYLFVDGEYVADLFSTQFASKSSLSNMFMGYKVRWREYVEAIHRSLDSVKIRDLTGLLKGRLKKLSSRSSHKDVVFLIQNLESLSRVLQAKIPTNQYSSMLSLLFDEVANEKLASITGNRGPLKQTVTFTAPHIKIHEELSQKKFIIQAQYKISFGGKNKSLGGREKLEEFSREVGYEDFLDRINEAFGNDTLVNAA